jgi:hypothetical protein
MIFLLLIGMLAAETAAAKADHVIVENAVAERNV